MYNNICQYNYHMTLKMFNNAIASLNNLKQSSADIAFVLESIHKQVLDIYNVDTINLITCLRYMRASAAGLKQFRCAGSLRRFKRQSKKLIISPSSMTVSSKCRSSLTSSRACKSMNVFT